MAQELIADKRAFRERVERISNLPTLPRLLQRFSDMVQNPGISMEVLGKELSKDQVLTSKLLKMVNSSFYGFPGRIGTITHAIVLLGYDALKGLIVTSSIFENLPREAFPLWRHSIAVSQASRAIATKLFPQEREEFAVAGLLHDIGKVILHLESPDEYHAVLHHACTEGKPMWLAESELLGFDHATIGFWICEKWTLPAKLAVPIGYHHMPGKAAAHKPRTAAIALADVIVRAMGCGAEGDLPLDGCDPFIEQQLPANETFIEEIVEEIEPEIESIRDLVPGDMM